MDDLEKAILFTFDQSGAVDANLRAQAQAYCDQAKQSPEIWRVCLERCTASRFAEVQFWCLQILEDVVRRQYASLSQQDRQLFQQSLGMALLGSARPEGGSSTGETAQLLAMQSRPVFVRNKLAQIVVLIIYLEYPSGWPSIFVDLVQAVDKGPPWVDMMCRVFSTLDDEVISLDYPRTSEDNVVAMRIKDAMRQQCIVQVVNCWYQLVVAYCTISPEVAASVLETMHRYVSWIDIGLVANEQFIPLLFRILSSPQEPAKLRGAAADCILAVITKRMEPLVKVTLLQRLQMSEVCRQLSLVKEPEFALKVTALLTGLASELLDNWKRLQFNGTIATPDTMAGASSAEGMLDEVLPHVLYFMEHGDEDISQTTFQFLLAYVASLKKGSRLSQHQEDNLAQILAVVRSCMQYDEEVEDSLDTLDKDGVEEEERMNEYRRDLFTLLKNIARIAPAVSKQFVQSNMTTVLSNPQSSFSEVETALSLFYQLGEGVTDEALKPGSGAMAEMAAALLTSSVPHHAHRVISLLFLETVVRYVRFVQQHAQYIPAALSAFLGDKGMHHPRSSVSSRASYLFMRVVKVLRVQLVPYLQSILEVSTSFASKLVSCHLAGHPWKPAVLQYMCFNAPARSWQFSQQPS